MLAVMAETDGENFSTKYQLYVEASTRDEFNALCKTLGMKKNEAATRVFLWFMRLEPMLRRHILAPLDPDTEVDIREVLKADDSIAGKIGGELTRDNDTLSGPQPNVRNDAAAARKGAGKGKGKGTGTPPTDNG